MIPLMFVCEVVSKVFCYSQGTHYLIVVVI